MNQDQSTEIAEGERWLAEFGSAAPSPECLDRIRRAMRTEAVGLKARGGARPERWRPWRAIAAAAVIALALTLAWRQPSSKDSVAGAHDELLTFLPSDVEASSMEMAELDDALSQLESWTLDSSSSDAGTLYDAFEENWAGDGGEHPTDGTDAELQ